MVSNKCFRFRSSFGIIEEATVLSRIETVWKDWENFYFSLEIRFFLIRRRIKLGLSSAILSHRPNFRNFDQRKFVERKICPSFSFYQKQNFVSALNNVHYAKTIRISHRLVSGVSYIQPPVVIIEYEELSLSQIGRNGLVRLDFESRYQMDLSSHIRDIWIAIGVLCGSGLLLAFLQTFCWFFRSGKQTIDLLVRK